MPPAQSDNPNVDEDHWQSRLTGHGIAYFREMVVDYKTLQWVNPYVAAAIIARKNADEKKATVVQAEEALKKSGNPDDPALKKLLADAKVSVVQAEEAAVLAEAKKAQADTARSAAEKIITDLIAKYDEKKSEWSDLLEFESALLRLLWGEKLRSRYESMAEEYKGLTGIVVCDAPKEEDSLRAKAETLLADLHWTYTTGPIQEGQRTRMVVALAGVTLFVVIIALMVACYWRCSILPWVVMAGALGAALSAFQRVQSREVKGDALTNTEKTLDGKSWSSGPKVFFSKLWSRLCANGSFATSPAIGALSAIVLAHLLASGLIQGSVFPKNGSTNAATKSPGDIKVAAETNNPANSNASRGTNQSLVNTSSGAFLGNAAGVIGAPTNAGGSNHPIPTPQFSSTNRVDDYEHFKTERGCRAFFCHCWGFVTCKDLALLLVWSFIAGFSERLVPDIISRLSDRAKAQGENLPKA